MDRGEKESLLRIQGQSLTLRGGRRNSYPLARASTDTIGDVADVKLGGPIKRGDASAVVKIEPDVNFAVDPGAGICADERWRAPSSLAIKILLDNHMLGRTAS